VPAAAAIAQPPVRVILDMDPATPGIQDSIRVAPGTTTVPGLALYIYDPISGPTRTIRSIGYFGGLDRGISIGHQTSNTHSGSVTSFTGHQGTGIIPGSFHGLTGAVEKGFDGPELHYVESGSVDWPLPAAPTAPVCTVDVHLSGAVAGDVYRIFVLDMVTVWRGTLGGGVAGAFTTQPGNWMDTGGDCVPDGTVTERGIDPDLPIPVPPASFQVDYIDSQNPANGGGGRIIIGSTCYANCDGSAGNPVLTANDFQCFLDRFAAGESYANCDQSTGVPTLTANDFQCFLNTFAAGCS
jgi:hypothetical protein